MYILVERLVNPSSNANFDSLRSSCQNSVYLEYNSTISCSFNFSGIWSRDGYAKKCLAFYQD